MSVNQNECDDKTIERVTTLNVQSIAKVHSRFIQMITK